MKRIYFDFYEGVHKDLLDKHDWFVRFTNDSETFRNPYYIDGDIDDVVQDAVGNESPISLEIVNCEWTRNPTIDIPCQYNVLVIDGVLLVTQSYMNERLEDCGFKRDDRWIFRRFWNHKNQNYAHWLKEGAMRGTSREELTVYCRKSGRKLFYDGKEFSMKIGLTPDGTNIKLGKKLPYNEQEEIIIPIINDMRSSQWNNKHEDIAQHLMEISGVGEHRVKDKV